MSYFFGSTHINFFGKTGSIYIRQTNISSESWLSHIVAPTIGGAWYDLPIGWTYTRTGSAETVQTSESTLVSGIGENIIRVGRARSDRPMGIVIESGTTNRLGSYWRDPQFPNAPPFYVTAAIFTTSGYVGPDGGGSPKRIQAAINVGSNYYYIAGIPLSYHSASQWCRSYSGTTRQLFQLGAPSAIVVKDITPAWERISIADPSGTLNTAITSTQSLAVLGEPAAARDVVVDFQQLEDLPYSTEATSGIRGQDILVAPFVHKNGRVSMYMRHRPKMTSNRLSNTGAPRYILYSDSNNHIRINHATRLITITVAGNSTTLSTPCPAFSADDILEWEIEAGGGVLGTTASVWINNVPTFLGASSPQGMWGVDTGAILSDGWSSWVEEVGFWP